MTDGLISIYVGIIIGICVHYGFYGFGSAFAFMSMAFFIKFYTAKYTGHLPEWTNERDGT